MSTATLTPTMKTMKAICSGSRDSSSFNLIIINLTCYYFVFVSASLFVSPIPFVSPTTCVILLVTRGTGWPLGLVSRRTAWERLALLAPPGVRVNRVHWFVADRTSLLPRVSALKVAFSASGLQPSPSSTTAKQVETEHFWSWSRSWWWTWSWSWTWSG